MENWEKIIIALILALVIFWLFPSARGTLENDRDAPADWVGLLIPIAAVIGFVFLLIAII